jgi:ABC-2 type transport system permease protein
MIRNKSLMFWTLAFPIVLGTFFNIAFGSIISNTENFSMIPVAVVSEDNNGQTEYFKEILKNLSQGEDALLSAHYTDLKKAEQMLAGGEIDGIFHINEKISLIVSKQGLNQSVLKTVSDSYIQISETVAGIAELNPAMIEQTIENLSNKAKATKEIYLGKGETDTFIQYFYALLAMTCLSGAYLGYAKVMGIQANMSPLAARRCVSPIKKSAMILGDLAAAATVQFTEALIVIAYLNLVLGVNFGSQWGYVVLTAFTGSIMGVSYGTFMSALLKQNENTMMGILTSSTLFMCFLSGLMIGSMKPIIEQNIPIINRINPAAVLSDAFYCLTVYDTYSRYIVCLVTMGFISAAFFIAASFVLRRKRYASI